MKALLQSMTCALVAVVFAGGCGRERAASATYAGFRALAGAERVQIVAPPGLDRARLERLAGELEARGRWSVEFSGEHGLDDSAARIWIADSHSPGIGAFAQLRGIVFEPAGAFWFQGERYDGPGDALRLTLSDPARPAWPVTLHLAAKAEHALAAVESLQPSWRVSARAWRDGLVAHDWIDDSRGGWIEASGRELLAEARSAPTRALLDSGVEIVTHGEILASDLDAYREQLARVRARVVSVFGAPDAAAPPLRLHLWSRLDHLALATGAWELSTPGLRTDEFHALLDASGANDFGQGLARALVVRIAGEPREAWALDGLATFASDRWQAETLESWQAWICAAGASPLLSDVLDPARRTSWQRFAPLRALAFRLAVQGRSAQDVCADWRAGSLRERIDRDAFDERCAALAVQGELAATLRRERSQAAQARAESWRGVHLLAARDDDGRRGLGYGSAACERALREIAQAGASLVVLAPIVRQEDAAPLAGGPLGREPFDATTSDAALWVAMRQARAAGLDVVLAPQLWSSRSGGLAGRRLYAEESQWAELFAELAALADHYGLLAELGGASTLCLADQIPEAAVDTVATKFGRPPPPHVALNTERWREVIAVARESFAGRLTYLAGVDGESDAIAFWPELDCIALTLHNSIMHPSFADGRPDDRGAANIQGAFLERALRIGAEYDKPVWLMRVGFAPTSENWSTPRAALGSYDTGEQERMLRAFATGLDQVRARGVAPQAVLYWNWTTDPEQGNAVDRSFTLQNRPAAELLPRLMQRP